MAEKAKKSKKKAKKQIDLFGTDVVAELAEQHDLSKNTVSAIVSDMFQMIGQHLHDTKEEGGSVKFSGLGTFTTSYMAARTIKNHLPTNSKSKKIDIPESYVIRFRSGKKLKDLVKDGEIAERKSTAKAKKKASKKKARIVEDDDDD